MLIYRVEKDNGDIIGVGPYGGSSYSFAGIQLLDEMCMAHCNEETHPSIGDDLRGVEIGCEWQELHCACPTLEALLDWFDGFIDRLGEEKFIVVEYEVSQFIMGNSRRQCFFTEDDVVSSRLLQECEIFNTSLTQSSNN